MAPLARHTRAGGPADRLFEKFRQATLDWLRPMLVDGLDTEDPAHAAAFEGAHARIMRFSDEIKRLPHDAPGALRAKAASAFYWQDAPQEMDEQIASGEYAGEVAFVDLIKATRGHSSIRRLSLISDALRCLIRVAARSLQ